MPQRDDEHVFRIFIETSKVMTSEILIKVNLMKFFFLNSHCFLSCFSGLLHALAFGMEDWQQCRVNDLGAEIFFWFYVIYFVLEDF